MYVCSLIRAMSVSLLDCFDRLFYVNSTPRARLYTMIRVPFLVPLCR